jgi:hypothetical protein
MHMGFCILWYHRYALMLNDVNAYHCSPCILHLLLCFLAV